MYISSIHIDNYKSFAASEAVSLSSGFNVIVGKNNSGKTAFIQATSLTFKSSPHNRTTIGNSSVIIGFTFSVIEFKELIKTYALYNNGRELFVPVLNQGTAGNEASAFMNIVNSSTQAKAYLKILCTYSPNDFISIELEKFGKSSSLHVEQPFIRFDIDENDYFKFMGGSSNTRPDNLFPIKLARIFKDRIYAFDAERMKVAKSQTGDSDVLKTDASNLAEVLNKLQGNSKRFDDFNLLVNRVFPEVTRITVLPKQGIESEIYVWDKEAHAEGRVEWAVPLSESGTGIGQVLAILYIVLTARFPKTIIIDEPQSFLHPGAVRELFEILGSSEFEKHQYIVTTHSPLVITACDPQNIIQISKIGAESHVEVFDKSDRRKLSEFLVEVGAKLSDVFGADNILWVEGPTEEICFPLILSKLSESPLLGAAIIGVKNTGDFSKKYKYIDKLIAMHTKLSETPNLLPQALGFLFDAEDLSDQNVEDYEKLSVYIIPRRMYENYLLNSRAIAFVLSALTDESVNPDEIEAWLQANQWKNEFFKPIPVPKEQNLETWYKKVHGATVLKEIFWKFSSETIEYDKVKYGPEITKWILENESEKLKELQQCIEKVIIFGKQNLESQQK